MTLWQLDPAYIPLPQWIQTTRAVVNFAGTDDDCFTWAMHPVDVHADRRGKYVEHMGKYDFSSLSVPVPLQAVDPFALRKYISFNAYGVSSTLVPDRHVDLLLFEHGGVQHYTTIRDFSRLVGRQLSNHGRTVHCCRRCLNTYSSQELLAVHALDCCHGQRTEFPKGPRCRFTNIQKQLLAPFVVYADFESILQRVGDEAMDNTQWVAMNQQQHRDPSKSTSHAAIHTRW